VCMWILADVSLSLKALKDAITTTTTTKSMARPTVGAAIFLRLFFTKDLPRAVSAR
jgi:hypothetical protein